MLLTQLLSASPLAVPQLTQTTSSNNNYERRDSITSSSSSAGVHQNHPKYEIRKQLITNWAEKPPDVRQPPWQNHRLTDDKRTKDLLIPLKSQQKRSNNSSLAPSLNIKPISHSNSHNNTETSFFDAPDERHYFVAIAPNESLQNYTNDQSRSRGDFHVPQEIYQRSTAISTTTNQSTDDFSIKFVVWIAAVIAISILGLVVGVLLGGPICLSSGTSSTQNTSSTNNNNNNAAAAATTTTTATTGAGSGGGQQTTNSAAERKEESARAFELIRSEKYEKFDIHKQQEQVSGSQDKRNSTCKPDHNVPMLSVQSPGCAGMEWLGVPSRTTIATSTTRDERSRRRRDNNETSSSSSSSSSSSITKANQYNHYPYSNTSSNSSSVGGMPPQICPNSNRSNTKASSIANQYPHHVQLPDGEYGDDRHLQIRTPSQQSEILRTYPRVPPNRTVSNVPDQLNYGRPNSHSTANIHEHFGSGRSINTSNSTPSSKKEEKKHREIFPKFSFFGFNKGPSNASKSADLSSIGGISAPRNINNNNNSSNNNNSTTTEGASSSHLLNLSSLPVPVVRNHPSSDHLTVNNYTTSSSSSSSSPHHHHHNNKPISCPASPSSPSQQAAANEDAEERRREQRLTPTSSDKILSSSLESPKSSKYM